MLTVDAIIEIDGGIVLIERKFEPHGWALPGGFVEWGETVEAATIREAKEETGLDIQLTELLGVYSDPRRDPRRHTVATVFVATATGAPQGGDDAAQARIFEPGNLPESLAFDHAKILDDYFALKRSGVRRPPAKTLL